MATDKTNVLGLHIIGTAGGSNENAVALSEQLGGKFATIVNGDEKLIKGFLDTNVTIIARHTTPDWNDDDEDAHQGGKIRAQHDHLVYPDPRIVFSGGNELGDGTPDRTRDWLIEYIKESYRLGHKVCAYNHNFQSPKEGYWGTQLEVLDLLKQTGGMVGAHKGANLQKNLNAQQSIEQDFSRLLPIINMGIPFVITELVGSVSPDKGWQFLYPTAEAALIDMRLWAKWIADHGGYATLYSLYKWASGDGFEYNGDSEKERDFRSGLIQINRTIPVKENVTMAKHYMPAMVCPPNSRKYRLFGMGDEAMQCVQAADGWVDQKKNELVEEFQITKTAIRRGNDISSIYTPDGLYRGFVQTQYSKEWTTEAERLAAYGADWCPTNWEEKASFVRRVWLVETWWDGRRKSAYWAVTTIKFVKFWNEWEVTKADGTKTGLKLKNVAELNWGGEENYFYAEGHGLVGWINLQTGRGSYLATYDGVTIRSKVGNPVSRPAVPFPPPVTDPLEPTVPAPQIPTNPGSAGLMTALTAIRMRTFPGISAPDVRIPGIPKGEIVSVYPATKTTIIDGYPWVFVMDKNGKQGWCAERGAWGMTFAPYVAPPPVEEDVWDEIDAPYVTQDNNLDLTADLSQNDCGIASGLIIVRNYHREHGLLVPSLPTVDQVAEQTVLKNPAAKGLTFTQVINAMKLLGFTFRYINGFSVQNLINYIVVDKKLVFLLLNYGVFNPADSFDGAHFAVLKGVNRQRTKFKFHDPYHGGANYVITRTVLENAIKNVPGNSEDYQGLILAND